MRKAIVLSPEEVHTWLHGSLEDYEDIACNVEEVCAPTEGEQHHGVEDDEVIVLGLENGKYFPLEWRE